jgi:uroporphyrinogen-III synthase
VAYAECYRRVRPEADARPLRQAFARGDIHAVTISSAEGLDNLLGMLGAAQGGPREGVAWCVPHARIAEHARARGLAPVLVAGPGDDEMLARLVAYFDAS